MSDRMTTDQPTPVEALRSDLRRRLDVVYADAPDGDAKTWVRFAAFQVLDALEEASREGDRSAGYIITEAWDDVRP